MCTLRPISRLGQDQKQDQGQEQDQNQNQDQHKHKDQNQDKGLGVRGWCRAGGATFLSTSILQSATLLCIQLCKPLWQRVAQVLWILEALNPSLDPPILEVFNPDSR